MSEEVDGRATIKREDKDGNKTTVRVTFSTKAGQPVKTACIDTLIQGLKKLAQDCGLEVSIDPPA